MVPNEMPIAEQVPASYYQPAPPPMGYPAPPEVNPYGGQPQYPPNYNPYQKPPYPPQQPPYNPYGGQESISCFSTVLISFY
jgi:hypothetical protein